MDPILIPITAIIFGTAIPIVAILSKHRRRKNSDTKLIMDEIKQLRNENLQLKNRLENVETIVTDGNYDLNNALNVAKEKNSGLLE